MHGARHEIALVLTQPDRPSGRGLKPKASAVAEVASELQLPVAKPVSLKSVEAIALIQETAPEAIVVAAYGLILPQSVLAIPPRGCLNIHASLLPRWRGAAPIQRAILAGDEETGVTIMVMEPGLDTGPVLLERRIPIEPADTTASLTVKLARVGAEAIVDALDQLGSLAPRPQDAGRASYAAKVDKAEAQIDWSRDARTLDRQVRALNPFPGAESGFGGAVLKIWESAPLGSSGAPGTVIGFDQGRPVIACGVGALALTIVQRPGSKRMSAVDFLKGRPMPPGTRLATVPGDT